LSEPTISIKKALPIIAITWILALVTTLACVYVAPNIFPPLETGHIRDDAIVTDKLADQAVTAEKILAAAISDTKLAPGAIPYNSTYSTTTESITPDSFTDLSGMSVEVTLARTSHLVIMFSGEAWVDGATDAIYVRAVVNFTVAYPDADALIVFTRAGIGQHGSYSYTFYLPDVDAGHYVVTIQWMMLSGTGHIADRTLNVLAFPA
jgi:hypothetical protein